MPLCSASLDPDGAANLLVGRTRASTLKAVVATRSQATNAPWTPCRIGGLPVKSKGRAVWEDGARGTAKGNCLGGTRGKVYFGTSGYIWQACPNACKAKSFFQMSVIKPETQASQIRPGLSNQGACAGPVLHWPCRRRKERERERETLRESLHCFLFTGTGGCH